MRSRSPARSVARQLLWIFALVFAVRLTHVRLLWIEEAYPMAAAVQMLHGRLPYIDFWFDKPPLSAALYLLWGAMPGWVLRLAGALYVTLCAGLAFRLGGRYAAWLLAAYLSFGIPSAVMALAPDLLLVAPHLAAVWLAQTGRPLWAGVVCGVGLLIHTKALFVLAAVLLWAPQWRTVAGFAMTLPIHALFGANYWQQVWWWGRVYSDHTFVTKPLGEFVRRLANWVGFHAAAMVAAFLPWRTIDWRSYAWLGLALVSVSMGLRFFPRYFFFLLVPVVVLAGRSLEQMTPRWRIAVLALVLIPVVRFGPRDVSLALGNEKWDDLALFEDSGTVVRYLAEQARPEDTLFVWGYRPDIDALSRLKGGTPFLESQPLDCVFADRHLREFQPMANLGCEQRLRRFREAEPNWLVDGLGPSNVRLRLEAFRGMAGYELVLRTPTAYLYKLVQPQQRNLDVRLSPDAVDMVGDVVARIVPHR
jgi:hypothetical protein